jgi:hypothetical protein
MSRVNPFNGHEVSTIQLIDILNASVDRLIHYGIMHQFPQQDCASTAIPFGADHFGAGHLVVIA